jgi:hypothetical protein
VAAVAAGAKVKAGAAKVAGAATAAVNRVPPRAVGIVSAPAAAVAERAEVWLYADRFRGGL